MSKALVGFVEANADAIQHRWASLARQRLFANVPVEAVERMTSVAFDGVLAYFREGDTSGLVELAEGIVAGRLPITGPKLVTQGFRAFMLIREAICEVLGSSGGGAATRDHRALSDLAAELVDRACAEYFGLYVAARERRARGTLVADLGLSTPVIQVWDRILVLPLIGTVDSARASQVIESLLEAVSRTEAKVAIIDVTGVPAVDTEVARHLLATVRSVRLLGTELILTGISPGNARTMASLDIDLSDITTRSSLKEGLRSGFEQMGVSVRRGRAAATGAGGNG